MKISSIWFKFVIVFFAFTLTGFGFPDIKKKTPKIDIPSTKSDDSGGGGFPALLPKLPDAALDKLVGIFYKIKIDNAKKEKKILNRNTEIASQVKRVFDNLKDAASRSKEYSDKMKGIKEWELHVIDSKEENAFAWLGGKIVVYTGILKKAKNEAGLAAILAHEMTHALDRHADERINDNLKKAGGIGATAAILNNQNVTEIDPKIRTAVLGGLGVLSVGTDIAFTRKVELESDLNGITLAVEAGYKPEAVFGFWRRALTDKIENKSGNFVYLQTHPLSQDRYNKVKKKKGDLKEMYKNMENQHGGLETLKIP